MCFCTQRVLQKYDLRGVNLFLLDRFEETILNLLYGFEKVVFEHGFCEAMLEVYCYRENPETILAAVNYHNLISHCYG